MDTIETRYVNVNGETARPTEKLRFLVTVSYDGATTLSDSVMSYRLSEVTEQAYRDNEWHFVTVTVTPEVNAVDIDLPQRLSGVEWGSSPDWAEDADMGYIIKHYAPDLISEVRKELIAFRNVLVNANLDDTDRDDTDRDDTDRDDRVDPIPSYSEGINGDDAQFM